jgi:hypothetical protein
MRRLPVAILVAAALTPLGAGASFAGQPNASCQNPGAPRRDSALAIRQYQCLEEASALAPLALTT